jgi:hypothetical protein
MRSMFAGAAASHPYNDLVDNAFCFDCGLEEAHPKAKLLRAVAQVHKVDTAAIALKVKQEFAGNEKARRQRPRGRSSQNQQPKPKESCPTEPTHSGPVLMASPLSSPDNSRSLGREKPLLLQTC